MAEEEEDGPFGRILPRPLYQPNDKKSEDADEEEDADAEADCLMRRGDRLRALREMERQDDLERERGSEAPPQHGEPYEPLAGGGLLSPSSSSSSSSLVLDYDAWLRGGQRYHDDLKHVDYRFIDFGTSHWADEDRRPLILGQDKAIGKGGFCWDAAYILGEYLSSEQALDVPAATKAVTVIELGAGTGLCGMMIAKARREWNVTLTDLPRLMPLLSRNVALNFDPVRFDKESWTSEGMDVQLSAHLQHRYGRSPALFDSGPPRRGRIRAQVLEWSEDVDPGASRDLPHEAFDIIAGADVVASIYDPIALARTIHRLAHLESTVYISFKERLSSVHRQFEGQLSDLFGDVRIVSPTPHASRNRNPQVMILVARSKKEFSPS